jgi:hypothetical protein
MWRQGSPPRRRHPEHPRRRHPEQPSPGTAARAATRLYDPGRRPHRHHHHAADINCDTARGRVDARPCRPGRPAEPGTHTGCDRPARRVPAALGHAGRMLTTGRTGPAFMTGGDGSCAGVRGPEEGPKVLPPVRISHRKMVEMLCSRRTWPCRARPTAWQTAARHADQGHGRTRRACRDPVPHPRHRPLPMAGAPAPGSATHRRM